MERRKHGRIKRKADRDMAQVTCRYRVEEYDEDDGGPYPSNRFIAGRFTRVEWDGYVLSIGKRKIRSNASFQKEVAETGMGYMGGYFGIEYLEIDGHIYVENKEGY